MHKRHLQNNRLFFVCGHFGSVGALKFCGLLILIALMVGCGVRDELTTEYGKISGVGGGYSLNGTGVLADLFKERGFRVRRRTKISPRIYQFQTLVWIPDTRACPSDEAIEAINEWLADGYMRTLIYVGRDYDARADYWVDVLEPSPVEDKEEILRRVAEAQLDLDQKWNEIYWWKDDKETCQWFDRKDSARMKTSDLGGPLARDISSGTEIEVSSMLVPSKTKTNYPDPDWKATPLLTAEGKDFVFKLVDKDDEYAEGQIIVVSNASFLLNFALVDPDNRTLAGNLIDRCDPGGDVLFLESGRSGIKVSDTDTNNHNSWAWIAEDPLCYIVPHFLFWGILFCFTFFPIFGRPRHVKQKSTSNFRNHVNALGKMIGRTDLPNRAINKIRKYQQMVSGDSKRKKD